MHDIQLRVCELNALLQIMDLWLDASYARGCSKKTIDHYRRDVGQFIKWMMDQKPNCTPEDVTPNDLRQWLIKRRNDGISSHKDWMMLRDKALLGVLLDTGLRIHEAQALKIGDITGDSLIIRGKGGKHRFVFLSSQVKLAVRKYLKACPVEFDNETPLWIGHQGPYTVLGLAQVIIEIGRRAGITPLGPHRLRRTFATWSLRSGCDIETLRRLMGHSSLTVLQGYFALVETDLKKEHDQYSPMQMMDIEEKRRKLGDSSPTIPDSGKNNRRM